MSQSKSRDEIERLVLLSVLTALVAVLSYFGGFIKIGGLASVSLTLIPVVLGASLFGPRGGAWLGFVSAAVFFLTADAAFWMNLSPVGTVVTVLIKGTLCGLAAGSVYRALEKKNRFLAVLLAAVVCPVINTGIFMIGCLTFFLEAVQGFAVAEGMSVGAYLILFFVGLNFVFELIANVVVSPALHRLLTLKKKL